MQLEKIKFFASYIESQLGIVYSEANYFQLESRLVEISRDLGLKDLEGLWSLAQVGISGELKSKLLDIATNNETYFFRDPPIFKAIENYILPKILSEKKMGSLRIWSAASSTGQEAYTMAILLKEYGLKTPLPPIEIVGTDISDRVLKKAQSGTFTQLEVQRGLPAPLMIKYFKKPEVAAGSESPDEWTAIPEIRNVVSFKKLNLLDGFERMGMFDLILCRNVLIYQNIENKKKILSRLTSCLTQNGFLVLGAAESLLGLSQDYEQIGDSGAIFFQKKNPSLIKSAA